jgi:hypothetical protein
MSQESKDKDHGNGHNKDYEIIINGTPHVVDGEQVSYEQVVGFAFPTPPEGQTRFTVTFYKAHKPKEGTLGSGETVEVKKQGTVFNVKATTKS